MAEPADPCSAGTTRKRHRAVLSWMLFLLLETATQVVFKLGGRDLDIGNGFWSMLGHAASSPWVIGGFCLYFCCFLLWMTILKDADLGRAFPMTALIYLCTLAAAVFLFQERLTLIRSAGIVTIIVGVMVLVTDKDSDPAIESPVHG